MAKHLSFRQIRTFVEVMRTGSLSEAARVMGRTQPSISATISGLEEEVGFQLFERERKRLTPRPEAHYFLEEAQLILDRLTNSIKTLQEIGNLTKGNLRIVCNPAAANYFIPQTLSDFLGDKPELTVSLMIRSSPVVADLIASQHYDIGFGESPASRETINSHHFAFPCVCAVSAASSLAHRKAIGPKDLQETPMALLYNEHSITIRTKRAFEDAGATLHRRFECQTFRPALHMTAQGLCAVICDSFSAYSFRQEHPNRTGIAFIPFEPTIYLNMSLMTPASRPLSMLGEALFEEASSQLEKYLAFRGP